MNASGTSTLARITRNSLHLFLAQGFNLVYPLLTLPYLTSRLGLHAFGVFAFCQVVIFYLQGIVDYGFALTATRHIAAAQGDKVTISRVFFSVLAAKILLALAVTIIGGAVLVGMPLPGDVKLLYACSFLSVWGSALYPMWFFHGMESMRAIAWLNLLSKLVGIAILVMFVRNPADIAIAGLAQSVPTLAVAVSALVLVYKSSIIVRVNTSVVAIYRVLAEGRHVFVANMASLGLANAGTFVLGLSSSAEVVGIYNAAERIVKSAVACVSPLTQAVYPNNVRAFSRSLGDGFSAVTSTGRYILLISLVLSCAVFFLSQEIANVFHWTDSRYQRVMAHLAPWIFFGVLNNMLGIQVLTAMGKGYLYGRILAVISVLAVIALAVLVPLFKLNAVVLTMNAAEVVLTIALGVVISKVWLGTRVGIPVRLKDVS